MACATAPPEESALQPVSRSSWAGSPVQPVTSPVRLIVDNRCFNDVRLYAIQNGVTQIPLGRVEAVSTREVVLPASLVAARTIRLVAVPLATGRQTTIDLDLYDGGTAIWYLQNEPAFSRLVKR